MLDGRFVQIPYLDRFVENRYCPVCHTRCQGFLLMGMAWCTQEGRARPGCDYFKGAYSHLLVGTCHCGQKHDRVVAFVHPPVPLTPTPRQDEPESLGAVLPRPGTHGACGEQTRAARAVAGGTRRGRAGSDRVNRFNRRATGGTRAVTGGGIDTCSHQFRWSNRGRAARERFWR